MRKNYRKEREGKRRKGNPDQSSGLQLLSGCTRETISRGSQSGFTTTGSNFSPEAEDPACGPGKVGVKRLLPAQACTLGPTESRAKQARERQEVRPARLGPHGVGPAAAAQSPRLWDGSRGAWARTQLDHVTAACSLHLSVLGFIINKVGQVMKQEFPLIKLLIKVYRSRPQNNVYHTAKDPHTFAIK